MATKNGNRSISDDGSRGREQRPFPASSFEEALELARAIHRLSSGKPIRRLTLFDQLGRSPESGPSRQLITNSSKYGLTKGHHKSDLLELTPDGFIASSDDVSPRERTRAQIKLAILDIPSFNGLHQRFESNKLPAKQVLIDAAKEQGLSDELAEEAVDTFIVNLQFVGLLKTLSGAERIISIDHLLDSLPASDESTTGRGLIETRNVATGRPLVIAPNGFDSICFYITPIGDDGSEHRQHSDLFLGSLVEPALEAFKLRVVRADQIDKPGMITRQIVDHCNRSRRGSPWTWRY